MNARLYASVLVCAALVAGGEAHANLTYTCKRVPSQTWFVPTTAGITVPVYSVSSGTLCANTTTHNPSDASIADSIGKTQAETDLAIQRSLDIWNEESGGLIQLRYMGATTNCTISSGVLIYGWNEDEYHQKICSSGNYAEATAVTTDSNGHFVTSLVEFFRWTGTCSTEGSFSTDPIAESGATLPFVSTLTHELGHAVYNIGDIGCDTCAPGTDCYNYGQVSIMLHSASSDFQTLGNWDLEVVQSRYGSRSKTAHLYKTTTNGSSGWYAALNVNGDTGTSSRRPVFPASSMTQSVAQRAVGWIYSDPLSLPAGGGGSATTTTYASTLYSPNRFSSTAIGRPIAITSSPSVCGFFGCYNYALLAYEKVSSIGCASPPCDMYTTNLGQVCYRISSNGGTTWGSEICPGPQCEGGGNPGASCTTDSNCSAPGNPGHCEYKSVSTFGLGATYDPSTYSFVVSYATGAFDWKLHFFTVDLSGNVRRVTGTSLQSTHAPGLACSSSECIAAYHTYDHTSELAWSKFHLDSNGGVVIDSSRSQGWLLYSSPSITVDQDNGVYRLAYESASNAIYSYSMAIGTGTSWTGTGDIFNNTSRCVSQPAMSSRPWSTLATRPYAWFVDYW